MSLFRAAAPRLLRAARAPAFRTMAPAVIAPRILQRSFTQTASVLKKDKAAKASGKKGSSAAASAAPSADAEGHDADHPVADPANPRDLADVESRWARTEKHYQDALRQFKSGGSFNPDVLGALPVTVRGAGGRSTTTYPLREVAQVVPRTARSVSLLAFEKDYIKPIMSAVQASPDFNQQPQADPDNELELVLKIEAVPAAEMTKKLGELCHAWREQVRNIRAKREKTLQAWTKDKKVLPDVAKVVSADLLKAMQKRVKVVDAAETQAANEIKRKAAN